VAAHVLVDGFGSRDMPAEFARELRDAGARLLVFRPEVWRFPFRRDRLRRMHRKIAVADGRVAFVGASTSSTTWTRRGRSRRATTTP